MSDNAVKETAPVSSPATTEPSMTRAEALAIAWTGIEAMGKMGLAKVYHSPLTGRVQIELSETVYEPANGLVPMATLVTKAPKVICEECNALAIHFVRDYRRFPNEKLGIMVTEPIDGVHGYCAEHQRESIAYE